MSRGCAVGLLALLMSCTPIKSEVPSEPVPAVAQDLPRCSLGDALPNGLPVPPHGITFVERPLSLDFAQTRRSGVVLVNNKPQCYFPPLPQTSYGRVQPDPLPKLRVD